MPEMHITYKAPASRLLALEIYTISPKGTREESDIEYVVSCNGEFVGSHSDVTHAIEYAVEHFNTTQSKLLARIAQPQINLHFSVR